jgi:hypothetical protein
MRFAIAHAMAVTFDRQPRRFSIEVEDVDTAIDPQSCGARTWRAFRFSGGETTTGCTHPTPSLSAGLTAYGIECRRA